MRTLPKIAGACAIAALAGTAAWASSAPVQHRLTVWLPAGGSEQITYTGDVAPKVSFTPSDFAPVSFPSPLAFDEAMPIDRIAMAMDADMASMFREADTMMALPAFNGITEANLGAMPPGAQSYSVVSTMNGNNVCTRSVEITGTGTGKPQIVRHVSGNCAATPGNPMPGDAGLSHVQPARDNHLMTVGSRLPEYTPSYPHI